jgi:phosphoribosylamine--glycine ligase
MTAEITKRTMDEIVLPTVAAMRQMGAPFKGVLFAGLMITADGPKLIEYNTRFGDPECQVMMLRLMSDLVPALIASRDGQLKNFDLRWYDEAALIVVMASQRLSGQLRQGLGDRRPRRCGRDGRRADLPRRHQGLTGGRITANGGRVLGVAATGSRCARRRRAPMRRSTGSTGRAVSAGGISVIWRWSGKREVFELLS